jgi:hypothetical protein
VEKHGGRIVARVGDTIHVRFEGDDDVYRFRYVGGTGA